MWLYWFSVSWPVIFYFLWRHSLCNPSNANECDSLLYYHNIINLKSIKLVEVAWLFACFYIILWPGFCIVGYILYIVYKYNQKKCLFFISSYCLLSRAIIFYYHIKQGYSTGWNKCIRPWDLPQCLLYH